MVLNEFPLAKTPCFVEVLALRGHEDLVERLREMGFAEGARLEVVSRLPFGGPWLVTLGSTSFALRDAEAQCATVRILP